MDRDDLGLAAVVTASIGGRPGPRNGVAVMGQLGGIRILGAAFSQRHSGIWIAVIAGRRCGWHRKGAAFHRRVGGHARKSLRGGVLDGYALAYRSRDIAADILGRPS